MHTFLWHDYETFGVNPARDRPAQFAAVRTDADLNEIGEPVMMYCQPAPDYLPDPVACLITGITPQICLQQGLPEHEFAQRIEQLFRQPDTIGTGYNSFHFDDEVTRYLLWRNLRDPYAREWQNGCGRWDLINVLRAAFALRPDGMEWPMGDDARPTFKLERLSVANGLEHSDAHDALADVRVTIELARRLKQAQPRLFDFCLKLRDKTFALSQIDLAQPKPFLHVTGMVPVERGCLMLAYPLAMHPSNKNEVLVWDLAADPSELANLDADTIRQRLFSKTAELPAGQNRLPIKSIHLNRAPIVISNIKTLEPAQAKRWGIDFDQQQQHAECLRKTPAWGSLWHEVYQTRTFDPVECDAALYQGFVSHDDRQQLEHLALMDEQQLTQQLGQQTPRFKDARLPELLFRYRARNFPQSLNESEQQRWLQLRTQRLHEGKEGSRRLQDYFDQMDSLAEHADERTEHILSELYDYATEIAL